MAQTSTIALPKPDLAGKVTLERALAHRRSTREYARGALTLAEVSQLLWAAHGVTGPGGRRTTPSAGALYPLEIDLVAGDVTGLAPGVYRYLPQVHALQRRLSGDRRDALAKAALDQGSVRTAAAVVAVSAVVQRTAAKYRERAPRYVDIEVGAVGQSVSLEAAALGLGTVLVGAFDDAGVARVLDAAEAPLLLLPLGRLP